MKETTPCVLTIAGFDPSGGAGILADLETFFSMGTRGFAVSTSLTGQNSQGVMFSKALSPADIKAQWTPLVEDFTISAMKVGMIGTVDNIVLLETLFRSLQKKIPMVLDPILVSSSGQNLLPPDARRVLCQKLFPFAKLVTPNIEELTLLSGKDDIEEGVKTLLSYGVDAVLVTGGDAKGSIAKDILYQGEKKTSFSSSKIPFPAGVKTVRGTGCRLSAGIATGLAKNQSLVEAIQLSKQSLDRRFQAGIEIPGEGLLGYFRMIQEKNTI